MICRQQVKAPFRVCEDSFSGRKDHEEILTYQHLKGAVCTWYTPEYAVFDGSNPTH